jgi:hypothetical protein
MDLVISNQIRNEIIAILLQECNLKIIDDYKLSVVMRNGTCCNLDIVNEDVTQKRIQGLLKRKDIFTHCPELKNFGAFIKICFKKECNHRALIKKAALFPKH